MEEFEIKLASPSTIFYAGQMLHGKVVIELSESKKMSAVRLKVFGKGKVHFTTQRDVRVRDSRGHMRTEKETIDHWANEEYMDHETILFGGDHLGPGLHEFPFDYMIPPNVPTSFEGDYGCIRYTIQAEIVRNWLWNHRAKMNITVISILDLNQFPECSEPGHESNSKTFCCLCCTSGPLTSSIVTDKTGFVPGEYIVVSAMIENQSRKDMKTTEVKLVEKTIYRAGYETKESERTVMEMKKGEIESGDNFEWDREPVLVPPLAPTWLGGSKPCGIIEVTYTLSFRVNPHGVGFSLYTHIPILIGNIPLRPMFNKIKQDPGFAGGFTVPEVPPSVPYITPGAPLEVAEDGGSSSSSSSSDDEGGEERPAPVVYYHPPPLPDYFNTYNDLPPPSYAQSMWGQVNVQADSDDENTSGNFRYAPVYPTYNFTQPSAPPY